MVPVLVGLGIAALIGIAIICISVSYYLNRRNLPKTLHLNDEISNLLNSHNYNEVTILDEDSDEVELRLESGSEIKRVKIECDGNAFYRGDTMYV